MDRRKKIALFFLLAIMTITVQKHNLKIYSLNDF